MSGLNKQKGITMWGIMLIVLIGIFFLLLFFKLFPPYMEDAQISSALNSFAEEQGARNKSPQAVIESIDKKFSIDGVRNVVANRDVKVVPDGKTFAIEIDYIVEIEIAGNASVLLYFSHHVPVP